MTAFEKKVYKALLTIPLGEVRTYKWLAEKAGRPRAYRAVGQILKKNPWPLIVPCHRVIESSGKLGGYAWGKKRKEKLLDLERQIKKIMV
ncbi:MAG: MGMT family protein [Candidatus Omnitrophica bacterium]|nr:MGMT family protein [Candidatus Omnitrophota bacterium]MDD5653257.1 MGMT family protein [Candidatus Omnitrophota bacterium]